MRTIATFKSDAFNTSEERDYFINPDCFGDDLAKWLMVRLREDDIEADHDPEQEDFGWYFNFKVPEGEHCCVLGYRPDGEDGDDGEWVAQVEKSRGLVGSLLMGRNRGVAPSAVAALHRALSNRPEVRGLQWHVKEDFDGHREEGASEVP